MDSMVVGNEGMPVDSGDLSIAILHATSGLSSDDEFEIADLPHDEDMRERHRTFFDRITFLV